MDPVRLPPWKRIWKWISAWLNGARLSGDQEGPASHLSSRLVEMISRPLLAEIDREFIARMQRLIGLSPTQGHELIQDLHLIKCRSGTRGAPRPTTALWNHKLTEIGAVLKQADVPAVDTIEEVRTFVRRVNADIYRERRS